MRERQLIGHTSSTRGPCGHQGLALTESRLVRRGLSRLSPRFDGRRRVYELCEGCGTKHAVELVA